MFDFSENELKKFLNGEAFFKDENTFCLGKSLEEAGKVFLKVVEKREEKNVGMANEKDK